MHHCYYYTVYTSGDEAKVASEENLTTVASKPEETFSVWLLGEPETTGQPQLFKNIKSIHV